MFDISKRFKELRLNNSLSANKLAKLLEVDPSTISKIENGLAKPSLDLLIKFCTTLNISMNDFFNDNSNVAILDSETKELLNIINTLSLEQRLALFNFLKLIN